MGSRTVLSHQPAPTQLGSPEQESSRQGATCHFCPDDRPRFPASPDPAWVALDQETQDTVGCGFPYLISCCILLVSGLALLPLGQKGSLPCRSSLLDPGLGSCVMGPAVSLKLPLWRCSLHAPVPCLGPSQPHGHLSAPGFPTASPSSCQNHCPTGSFIRKTKMSLSCFLCHLPPLVHICPSQGLFHMTSLHSLVQWRLLS